MKIRPLLIYEPWDLEKFRDHPLFSGRGSGSQFPGLGVPHRKNMKYVNNDGAGKSILEYRKYI